MRYLKSQEEPSFVCVEIDFSKIFKTSSLDALEKYEFGMLFRSEKMLFPVISTNKEIFDNIINQFGNSTRKYQRLHEIAYCKLFTFYHILYYNLSLSAQENKVEVDWDEIDEEYEEILDKVINKIIEFGENSDEYIEIDFNKTVCQKNLFKRGYKIVKDEFKLKIVPISFEIKLLDENYLENNIRILKNLDMSVYSIISKNSETNREKLLAIVRLKRIRYILFCALISFIILCFYILLISLISQYFFNPIYDIQKQSKKLEITKKNNFILEEDKTNATNKEIIELKEIYGLMRKIQIIKNAFEKENYLKKHNVEFYNLIKDIKKKDIKDVCISFLGFYHFQNGSYNLADSEFHSTILCLQEKENEIISGKNAKYDDKMKDAIKRSSTETYRNEYSFFEKIDENLLLIIKIKILRQRFIYLQ